MTLDERSKQLRTTVIKMMASSRRGHLGSAFSLIEILSSSEIAGDLDLVIEGSVEYSDDRNFLFICKGAFILNFTWRRGCLLLFQLLLNIDFINIYC